MDSATNVDRPRILMPMMEAGAGHLMPARAVRDAIEARYPGEFQIDVVDFLKECGAYRNDRHIKRAWDLALKHPRFARAAYLSMQALHPLSRYYMQVYHPTAMKMTKGYVAGYKPDVIFSTHHFSLTAAARAKHHLNGTFKVIGFITDPFTAYTFWAELKADVLMVASESAKKALARLGVEEEVIEIHDFPIHERFLEADRSRAEIQKQIGIDTTMPTLLATAGGQGIGKVTKYVEKLYRRGARLNIVFVCGRNEQVRSKFEALAATPSHTNLLVFGFADNMHELLNVSDFSAIKAGASATLEALMANTPPIITDWAVYAEKPNMQYAVENHFGWWAGSERQFMAIIDEILNTDVLSRFQKNIEDADLKTGSGEIAEYLVSLARAHWKAKHS